MTGVVNSRIDRVLEGALRIGLLAFDGATINTGDETIAAEAARVANAYRSAYRDFDIGSIPGVAAARELFRALGIDPTKTRPSSEALLRRALRGQPFPAINTAVDVANLVQLRRLLPVGLYDRHRLSGDVEVRLGRPGEEYEAISGDVVHLDGRIAVCDDLGPFGNPTRDSRRAQVGDSTRAILFLVFAPGGFEVDALRDVLREAEDLFARHLGATTEVVDVLPH